MGKLVFTSLCFTCVSSLWAQSSASDVFAARVGAYVEQYYARAQSLLVEETVVLQPLRLDLSSDGFARRLLYEVRVEWNASSADAETAPTVVRELVKARGPALGPPDKPDCLDPRGASPEPLAFLLPSRQQKMRFTIAGSARVDGRAAVMLDYRPVVREPPTVEWDDECGQIDMPGYVRGRIWIDPVTSEILRLDEHLTGQVDIPGPREGRRRATAPLWFTIDRADTTTEYRSVTFENPDETLMLPARIDSITVIRSSGMPRLRVTQTYANYRRFVTDSRILPPTNR